MKRAELVAGIFKKKSFLCIGLDTDIDKLPLHLGKGYQALYAFNRAIIDATEDLCVAYKLNSAFYEAAGLDGLQALRDTIKYIGDKHLVILDAKRGDIGNTVDQYARAAFDYLHADAITVAPYMGRDSVDPFLSYSDKWVILLALTSNPSCTDFELMKLANGRLLYEELITKAQTWADPDQLMFVLGATRTEQMARVRSLAPESFFLVPGIGAQGGSLTDVLRTCWIEDCGILVNSSRGIIYSSSEKDFALAARRSAKHLVMQMKKLAF